MPAATATITGPTANVVPGTSFTLTAVPTGFIPEMDQGYAIVVVQLPDSASLERTDAVIKQATDIALSVPGVTNAVAFSGFSGATFTNASNQGVLFTTFADFKERAQSLKRKVQGAMIYPVAVITVATAIVTFIMIWIIPRFQDMFQTQMLSQQQC